MKLPPFPVKPSITAILVLREIPKPVITINGINLSLPSKGGVCGPVATRYNKGGPRPVRTENGIILNAKGTKRPTGRVSSNKHSIRGCTI